MANLISRVRQILSTTTLKKSSITFSGTIANAFFGAVFYILAARFLGPSNFGIMTIALTVLTLTSDMGDLGTDTGLVNFVSRYINKQKEKALKFLKLGLKVKIYVWIFVLVFGLFFSGFIANSLFLKPELVNPLRIAFIGVGALLLFSFIVHSLQAMQRFWSWSMIQAGTNLLRLLLFLAIFYLGVLNIETTLWVYILVPFLGFMYGIKMIGRKFLSVKSEWSVSKDFFKYNKWVAAFTAVAAISARMDTFIAARLLDSVDVGIYSAANQMVKIVPQIVIAVGTVVGPKMAELGNIKDFVSYLKKTQLLVFGLSVLGIFSIPVVLYLIPFLFGVEYVDSGNVFVVLLFAMLIFLVSVPVHMAVFYYFSYPKLFFNVGIIHLFLVSFGGWYMINTFGVMGAAYTVLIAQIIDFVIPLYYVINKIRKDSGT